MSCDVVVEIHGAEADALADLAVRRLDELERRWSRFLPDSEISQLNRAGGAPRRCHPDTVRLVRELVGAWWLTDGAFDPTLLAPLVELGYATSRSDHTLRTSIDPGALGRGRPDAILIDGTHVRVPIGTVLDPGGLGKGLAADIVVDELLRSGATGALVAVGGDLRVGGDPPGGDAWSIDVAATPADAPVRVRLRSGGVATSTTRLRTWTRSGDTLHHLLDPVTRRPTDGEIVASTVIAGSGATAEAFTKLGVVRGRAVALAAADRHGLAMRLTCADGRTVESPAWQEFAR